MKPLVLALSVALFATLLSLGSASNTDAGVQVVKTYQGFVRRASPKAVVLACTRLKDLASVADGEKVLQDFANGENDQVKTITLGTPTIIGIMVHRNRRWITYCKYVPEDQAGTRLTTRTRTVFMATNLAISFYAKKVADMSPATIDAAVAEVLKLAQDETDPKMYAEGKMQMIEITTTNEIYAGPFDSRTYRG